MTPERFEEVLLEAEGGLVRHAWLEELEPGGPLAGCPISHALVAELELETLEELERVFAGITPQRCLWAAAQLGCTPEAVLEFIAAWDSTPPGEAPDRMGRAMRARELAERFGVVQR